MIKMRTTIRTRTTGKSFPLATGRTHRCNHDAVRSLPCPQSRRLQHPPPRTGLLALAVPAGTVAVLLATVIRAGGTVRALEQSKKSDPLSLMLACRGAKAQRPAKGATTTSSAATTAPAAAGAALAWVQRCLWVCVDRSWFIVVAASASIATHWLRLMGPVVSGTRETRLLACGLAWAPSLAGMLAAGVLAACLRTSVLALPSSQWLTWQLRAALHRAPPQLRTRVQYHDKLLWELLGTVSYKRALYAMYAAPVSVVGTSESVEGREVSARIIIRAPVCSALQVRSGESSIILAALQSAEGDMLCLRDAWSVAAELADPSAPHGVSSSSWTSTVGAAEWEMWEDQMQTSKWMRENAPEPVDINVEAERVADEEIGGEQRERPVHKPPAMDWDDEWAADLQAHWDADNHPPGWEESGFPDAPASSPT